MNKPLLSLNDLAHRLGMSLDDLHRIAGDIGLYYRTGTRWNKKCTKVRNLDIPVQELKILQRRIVRLLSTLVTLSPNVHGAVRGCSPKSNAELHLAQPWLVTLDAKSFFESIRHYVVYRMFRRELGMGRDVARLLTLLTTFDSKLPQGAPTSPMIANLALARAVDRPLGAAAAASDITYSRYVDDIALSGQGDPRPLINVAAKLLSTRRVQAHRAAKGKADQKLRIMPAHRPQVVTGLTVNGMSGPSIPRAYRDSVRAAIHQLPSVPLNARGKAIDSIRGRIGYVRQFNAAAASRLDTQLAHFLAH